MTIRFGSKKCSPILQESIYAITEFQTRFLSPAAATGGDPYLELIDDVCSVLQNSLQHLQRKRTISQESPAPAKNRGAFQAGYNVMHSIFKSGPKIASFLLTELSNGLDKAGKSSCIFLGLSFLAWVIDTAQKVQGNVTECITLLNHVLIFTKLIRRSKDILLHDEIEDMVISQALEIIINSCMLCSSYIHAAVPFKFVFANSRAQELNSLRQSIQSAEMLFLMHAVVGVAHLVNQALQNPNVNSLTNPNFDVLPRRRSVLDLQAEAAALDAPPQKTSHEEEGMPKTLHRSFSDPTGRRLDASQEETDEKTWHNSGVPGVNVKSIKANHSSTACSPPTTPKKLYSFKLPVFCKTSFPILPGRRRSSNPSPQRIPTPNTSSKIPPPPAPPPPPKFSYKISPPRLSSKNISPSFRPSSSSYLPKIPPPPPPPPPSKIPQSLAKKNKEVLISSKNQAKSPPKTINKNVSPRLNTPRIPPPPPPPSKLKHPRIPPPPPPPPSKLKQPLPRAIVHGVKQGHHSRIPSPSPSQRKTSTNKTSSSPPLKRPKMTIPSNSSNHSTTTQPRAPPPPPPPPPPRAYVKISPPPPPPLPVSIKIPPPPPPPPRTNVSRNIFPSTKVHDPRYASLPLSRFSKQDS